MPIMLSKLPVGTAITGKVDFKPLISLVIGSGISKPPFITTPASLGKVSELSAIRSASNTSVLSLGAATTAPGIN